MLIFIGKQISAKAEKIKDKRNNFVAFTKQHDSFGQLQSAYASTQKNMAKLESAIPSLDNISEAADYLNSIGPQTSNIVSIKFNPTPHFTSEEEFGSLGFSMNIRGTMITLLDLLKKIETAPYAIEIKNVSLSVGGSVEGEIAASAAGVIYLRKQTNNL